MNVRLLRQVQKFLREEPRRFDMSDWVQDANSSKVLESPPCGTACCIAGAAAIIVNKVSPGEALNLRHEFFEFLTRGTRALRLTSRQEDRLFYRSCWPAKFRQAYNNAETPLQRVKAGVARIEHFIETKGKE